MASFNREIIPHYHGLYWQLSLLLIASCTVVTEYISAKYKSESELQARICPSVDLAFTEYARSKSECLGACLHHPGCHSTFYNHYKSECHGCSKRYDEPSGLDPHDNTTYMLGTCEQYLVSGQHGIPDSYLNASSYYPPLEPAFARLNTTCVDVPETCCWSAEDNVTEAYIQATFPNIKLITAVATRGRPDNPDNPQYVTAYNVLYSADCTNFLTVLGTGGLEQNFIGNYDMDTLIFNQLPSPVYARCVRIRPATWIRWRSMRFDLIGCL